jgi:hypothetical protein
MPPAERRQTLREASTTSRPLPPCSSVAKPCRHGQRRRIVAGHHVRGAPSASRLGVCGRARGQVPARVPGRARSRARHRSSLATRVAAGSLEGSVHRSAPWVDARVTDRWGKGEDEMGEQEIANARAAARQVIDEAAKAGGAEDAVTKLAYELWQLAEEVDELRRRAFMNR